MSGVRGILHVHSSYSFDSTTPLEAIRLLARERNLSFVVQTEHSNELTAVQHRRYVEEAHALSDATFLLIPGVEYATADNRIHVLAIGAEIFWEDLRLCPPERLGELVERIRQSGGLSVLAHPERMDAIARVPPEVLERVDAIEVWNGKTDRLGPSPRAAREVIRRRAGQAPAPALVGLDLHAPSDFRPVGVELDRMPGDGADLVGLIRAFRYRSFFGPLRWDGSRCGRASVAVALVSHAGVGAARAAKRTLRKLLPRQ